MAESTTFLAAFPSIQSAIKIDGGGNGMRIQLDIPESELGEAMKLMLWREKVLKVTVGPESLTDFDGETEKGAKGSGDQVDCRRIAIRRD